MIYLTAQHSETKAEHSHVAKVESCLEESRHLGLHEEVVNSVEVDIASSGSC